MKVTRKTVFNYDIAKDLKKYDISLRKIAIGIGYSYTSLSDAKQGRKGISGKTYDKIIEFLKKYERSNQTIK